MFNATRGLICMSFGLDFKSGSCVAYGKTLHHINITKHTLLLCVCFELEEILIFQETGIMCFVLVCIGKR